MRTIKAPGSARAPKPLPWTGAVSVIASGPALVPSRRRALASAPFDDLVERAPVGAGDPLLCRPGLGVPRPRGVAEGEHGGDLLVGRVADDLAHAVRVGHAVRAGADPLAPGGQHHVLRRAPRVEGQRPLAGDHDRDHQRGAAEVVRRVHGLGGGVAVAEHDEAAMLAVGGAARDPAGLEDATTRVLIQRSRLVAAHLALADHGKEGVHPQRLRPRLGAGDPRRGSARATSWSAWSASHPLSTSTPRSSTRAPGGTSGTSPRPSPTWP